MVRTKCSVKRLLMTLDENNGGVKEDVKWISASDRLNFNFGEQEEESQPHCKMPRLGNASYKRQSRVEAGQIPQRSQLNRTHNIQTKDYPPVLSPASGSKETLHQSLEDVKLQENSRAKIADDDRPRLLVMRGDPTDWSTGAIVNDADGLLQHNSGLAATIVRKGGIAIQRQSCEWVYYHGEVEVGDAMWTTGGKLPSRFVIHAVGPDVSRHRWPTQSHQLELRQAIRSALVVADILELTSVAMPAISTGSGRYPKYLAAREIVAECLQFLDDSPETTVRLIVLMNEDKVTTSIFSQALKEEKLLRQLHRQYSSVAQMPHTGTMHRGTLLGVSGENLSVPSNYEEEEEEDSSRVAASLTALKWTV